MGFSDTDLDPAALWKVLEVTKKLSAPSELGALLTQVIDAACSVLEAERGTVLLYIPTTEVLFSAVATGSAPIRFSAKTGIAGQCATERRLINVPDCYADPRFNKEIDRQTGYRTRCLLAVPLIGANDSLVGVMQVLNKKGGIFTERDESLAYVLASQCAMAVQRAQLMEDRLVKQRLERDLEAAREIQRRALPRQLPQPTGYDLAAWSRPAEETGGDLYDAVQLGDGQVVLLVADATGHGIGPALSATQVRAMFRMALRMKWDLDSLCRHINRQLVEDSSNGRFVTAFVGFLNPNTHELRYQSAGQGPLLHYRASEGSTSVLLATTTPLGISEALSLPPAPVLRLCPGDVFSVLTDGIFELTNEGGEAFGTSRAADAIQGGAELSARKLIDRVQERVLAFAGQAPQADDITAALIRRLPGDVPPSSPCEPEPNLGKLLRQATLSIESRLENVDLVGQAVSGMCAQMFAEVDRSMLELCVVEAVTNSIVHGYRRNAGQTVSVTLCIFDDRIQIDIEDEGEPIPLDRQHPVEPVVAELESVQGLEEHGRGVFLMHRLMDRVEYRRDDPRNLLRLTKLVKKPS